MQFKFDRQHSLISNVIQVETAIFVNSGMANYQIQLTEFEQRGRAFQLCQSVSCFIQIDINERSK